jgi:SHS2 domain-containing protein
MYELFGHTADLGLRVRAASLDDLFADAARGLVRMLVANPQDIRPVETRRFDIAGSELEYLLFDWLSELLFAFETSGLLLCEFALHVGDVGLAATCRGETADRQRHILEHEVKAITYHGLCVARDGDGWLAEMIVDI